MLGKISLALAILAIALGATNVYLGMNYKKELDSQKTKISALEANSNTNTNANTNTNINANSNANSNANTNSGNKNINTNSNDNVSKSDALFLREAYEKEKGALEAGETFSVSQNDGTYAKGMVGGEGGGGFWLAVKTNGVWDIIFSGQSNPECSLLSQYNYPASMMSTCVQNGNEVNR